MNERKGRGEFGVKLNGNTAVYNEYTFKIHGFKRVITWMRVNDFLICRQGYDSERFGEVDPHLYNYPIFF